VLKVSPRTVNVIAAIGAALAFAVMMHWRAWFIIVGYIFVFLWAWRWLAWHRPMVTRFIGFLRDLFRRR
jgi:hypothetical protein